MTNCLTLSIIVSRISIYISVLDFLFSILTHLFVKIGGFFYAHLSQGLLGERKVNPQYIMKTCNLSCKTYLQEKKL